MASGKFPGPDGYTVAFFRRFWHLIVDLVCISITDSLANLYISEFLASTFLCFIPKNDCPRRVRDFRPISLCNVIYRLLSKLLAACLVSVLPNIISRTQSAGRTALR